jgi:hypothetical protein
MNYNDDPVTGTVVHSHIFTAVAWWRLSAADVPFPVCSRSVPGLSYQLLTETAHKDNPSSSVTNSPANSSQNQSSFMTLSWHQTPKSS